MIIIDKIRNVEFAVLNKKHNVDKERITELEITIANSNIKPKRVKQSKNEEEVPNSGSDSDSD